MKSLSWRSVAACISFLLITPVLGNAQDGAGKSAKRQASPAKPSATEAELAKLRADLVEKMKKSRARSEELLAIYEQERKQLTEEYGRRRSLYSQGFISLRDVTEAEVALANSIKHVQEVRRWLLEDDIAITEATMRDELLRLPALSKNGYSETASLIRFNGGANWSLADAAKIQEYFSTTFGRPLPISAYGQTTVHDRMMFDHRDAIDVAVHPDSSEGKSLMAYLRQSGIPFIAFRNSLPGAATGAHIHIGRPSLRNSTS
jgi:hypothetical protein